ncbi:uncharacterized protein LOC105914533 [Setaria italica]|uniref:uncharacterized protein LOC105914533 n=1 Tax=Setaria italica TaxID=4555 RepID=UPI000646B26C|nr:uncharacterized protein LOC105914533 [Setaria italica]
MTLTMMSNAYFRWASFFKSMCGKFGLRSVDYSVLDLAMTDDDQTTRELWLAIKGLFHANKKSWTIFLNHDFHSMTQGDSSIVEYCSRMKTLADALHDVGHPVQDSQLVLNVLRGLNPRFTNTADDIANSTADFPWTSSAGSALVNPKFIGATEYELASFHDLMEIHSASSSSLEVDLVHCDNLSRECFMAELAKHTPPVF